MAQRASCNNCGELLEDLNQLLSPLPPCPTCGCRERSVSVRCEEHGKISDHFSMLANREGKDIGFHESIRDGRAASADLSDDGSVSYSLIGSSPQGESTTLKTCQRLVDKLNSCGSSWSAPIKPHVDCESHDLNQRSRKLQMQVVRARVDQRLWERLNREKKFEEPGESADCAVARLKASITKKCTIPPEERPSLTLVLDANMLPGYAFDSIVARFNEREGMWAKSQGFAAIWIVGPVGALVRRLDEPA